jgi:hypothetical protein
MGLHRQVRKEEDCGRGEPERGQHFLRGSQRPCRERGHLQPARRQSPAIGNRRREAEAKLAQHQKQTRERATE